MKRLFDLYDQYVYWRLGPAARLVFHALDNPDAWEMDDHTMTHTRSGVAFWTGNGISYFKPHLPPMKDVNCFTGFERKVLWRKIEQWKLMVVFARMANLS